MYSLELRPKFCVNNRNWFRNQLKIYYFPYPKRTFKTSKQAWMKSKLSYLAICVLNQIDYISCSIDHFFTFSSDQLTIDQTCIINVSIVSDETNKLWSTPSANDFTIHKYISISIYQLNWSYLYNINCVTIIV